MRAIDEEFKYLLSPAVLITLVTYPLLHVSATLPFRADQIPRRVPTLYAGSGVPRHGAAQRRCAVASRSNFEDLCDDDFNTEASQRQSC